jgi:hypothetical protein
VQRKKKKKKKIYFFNTIPRAWLNARYCSAAERCAHRTITAKIIYDGAKPSLAVVRIVLPISDEMKLLSSGNPETRIFKRDRCFLKNIFSARWSWDDRRCSGVMRTCARGA